MVQRHALIEHEAFPRQRLFRDLLQVFEDAAPQMVHRAEAILLQVAARLFAADASGAEHGDPLRLLLGDQWPQSPFRPSREVAKAFRAWIEGSFEAADRCFVAVSGVDHQRVWIIDHAVPVLWIHIDAHAGPWIRSGYPHSHDLFFASRPEPSEHRSLTPAALHFQPLERLSPQSESFAQSAQQGVNTLRRPTDGAVHPFIGNQNRAEHITLPRQWRQLGKNRLTPFVVQGCEGVERRHHLPVHAAVRPPCHKRTGSPFREGVGPESRGTRRPAIGTQLDGTRGAPTGGESCRDPSGEAVAAAIGLHQRRLECRGCIAAARSQPASVGSLRCDDQCWCRVQCIFRKLFSRIEGTADQGVQLDVGSLQDGQAQPWCCRQHPGRPGKAKAIGIRRGDEDAITLLQQLPGQGIHCRRRQSFANHCDRPVTGVVDKAEAASAGLLPPGHVRIHAKLPQSLHTPLSDRIATEGCEKGTVVPVSRAS